MVIIIDCTTITHSKRADRSSQIDWKTVMVAGPGNYYFVVSYGQNGFDRAAEAGVSIHRNFTFIVLDMRGLLSFAIFWVLAMLHRKHGHVHMRYMIATGILAIGPGVSRGLGVSFGFSLGTAMTITDILDLLIVGLLLIIDLNRKKNYKPFLTVFSVLLIGTILWQLRDSTLWQSFAKTYSGLFY